MGLLPLQHVLLHSWGSPMLPPTMPTADVWTPGAGIHPRRELLPSLRGPWEWVWACRERPSLPVRYTWWNTNSSLSCLVWLKDPCPNSLLERRHSLALGRKWCCKPWGWNKSLSFIPNSGCWGSLIYYLFIIYYLLSWPDATLCIHRVSFSWKGKEEGPDPLIWFFKAQVVPTASWWTEEQTSLFWVSVVSQH